MARLLLGLGVPCRVRVSVRCTMPGQWHGSPRAPTPCLPLFSCPLLTSPRSSSPPGYACCTSALPRVCGCDIPTGVPSLSPTTVAPTTAGPTAAPTTAGPTAAPTTAGPTAAPTAAPSGSPTLSPTTAAPTSAAPSAAPSTAAPSTVAPSSAPTPLALPTLNNAREGEEGAPCAEGVANCTLAADDDDGAGALLLLLSLLPVALCLLSSVVVVYVRQKRKAKEELAPMKEFDIELNQFKGHEDHRVSTIAEPMGGLSSPKNTLVSQLNKMGASVRIMTNNPMLAEKIMETSVSGHSVLGHGRSMRFTDVEVAKEHADDDDDDDQYTEQTITKKKALLSKDPSLRCVLRHVTDTSLSLARAAALLQPLSSVHPPMVPL